MRDSIPDPPRVRGAPRRARGLRRERRLAGQVHGPPLGGLRAPGGHGLLRRLGLRPAGRRRGARRRRIFGGLPRRRRRPLRALEHGRLRRARRRAARCRGLRGVGDGGVGGAARVRPGLLGRVLRPRVLHGRPRRRRRRGDAPVPAVDERPLRAAVDLRLARLVRREVARVPRLHLPRPRARLRLRPRLRGRRRAAAGLRRVVDDRRGRLRLLAHGRRPARLPHHRRGRRLRRLRERRADERDRRRRRPGRRRLRGRLRGLRPDVVRGRALRGVGLPRRPRPRDLLAGPELRLQHRLLRLQLRLRPLRRRHAPRSGDTHVRRDQIGPRRRLPVVDDVPLGLPGADEPRRRDPRGPEPHLPEIRPRVGRRERLGDVGPRRRLPRRGLRRAGRRRGLEGQGVHARGPRGRRLLARRAGRRRADGRRHGPVHL
mmetsp:Transcript_30058/g.98320  ORF Transcript_30058/g.98320 Transcript_30058/m.98320 type:complete len:430 (-) Transcript_30058:2615-3904(-)